MDSVLATLRLNLLALSQRSLCFIQVLICNSRSGMLAVEKVTLVSSAHIQGEPLFKQLGRSLCTSKREGGLLLTLKVQFRGL